MKQLPENWCVAVNEKTRKTLEDWRKQGPNSLGGVAYGYLHNDNFWHFTIARDCTQITFEQFKEYVLKKKEIIGYKAPYKLFNLLEIGQLYIQSDLDSKFYYPKNYSKVSPYLLPKEIVETFPNANGPFPKFPNYPTVSTNFGKFIELTNGQVNLLSTYTEWSIMQTDLKSIILDMYK